MPPSLQTVVRRMNLRPLAGTTRPGVLDAAVRWVAVSELADPTPYLEGGELLLTTGMRMEGDLTGDLRGYVARLVRRGVAGLGFGVGVSHEEVPAALVEAAESAGLPLLEVPRETPFIAVGKAVSELLAAEQYEEISRAFAAQGRLTRAALRPEGMHAVIDRLAREVGGWAALLEETGEVRHATRGANTGAVAAELSRRLGRSADSAAPGGSPQAGSGGRMPSSLALSAPGEHIVVQPLGGGARPRGFFAVGAPHAFTPVTHTVVNAAGSLLTLAMEQGRAQLAAERRLRTAVLELLLEGEGERARTVLGAVGGRVPEAPLVVLAAGAEALDAFETRGFAALLGSVAVALVAEGAAEEVALSAEASVGVSQPVVPSAEAPVGRGRPGDDTATGLRTGLDQAERALEVARTRSGARPGRGAAGPGRGGVEPAGGGAGRVVRFGELAGQGLFALLDPVAAQAFSAAVLAPLTTYGSRADLVESLRAYLDSNGHWDAAAQRLGVHRHTLRYRMRRAAELLGRDLDDPGTRAELWLALEAARRAATPASPPGSSR
ncbi:PucR family transcriptional regulator [Nonomuraea sp. PA05]|uniref:PucR family transcriptional regulator n=1 Tax=Nonomuraea sp. PA05 TaxID=2604466 RepID=UPI0011D55553|nr:PucR family transcriptional regulator [Nonomuraea sp. PA05]TYB61498.1 PucR family transcriptional regulator [Nonomuraea sp. PA05]